MDNYDKKKKIIIEKLELKFNEAGVYGLWAENAARRAVKMWEDGMNFEKAVYKVYREL